MTKGGGIADFPNLGRRAPVPDFSDQTLQKIAEDINALRQAHVIDPLMLHTPVTLVAAGDSKTFDSQSKKISWIIAQAFTGVIDLYWTDGGGGGGLPPMRFEPTAFPILIPVSAKPYTFTAVANGGAATFSITLVA